SEDNSAPKAPTNLKQVEETAELITITWKKVSGSDIDYFVYVDGVHVKDTKDTKCKLEKDGLFADKNTVKITVVAGRNGKRSGHSNVLTLIDNSNQGGGDTEDDE
ncbi:MAG: hypothetical protein GX967_02395, partial [Clostridiales bacterium]|nr:hypothetical protein [Clostridiales bacterium]